QPAVLITEAAGGTAVTEGSAVAASYNVRLAKPPTAGTVTVTITPNAQVTVDTDLGTAGDQHTLTFSAGDYNVNKPVYVLAFDDSVYELPVHTGLITHAVTTAPAGLEYQGLVVNDVVPNVTDNDPQP